MNLRIVSGRLKGRVIRCGEIALEFRPTLERVRQSIADMLMPYLMRANVADVCAGSGAMGFELLSRGAAHVDFVENDRARIKTIRSHITQFGVEDACRMIEKDATLFAKNDTKQYDLIYFDPPYADKNLLVVPPLLLQKLSPDGILVFERRHKKGDDTLSIENMCVPFAAKKFGDTYVELFRASKDAS